MKSEKLQEVVSRYPWLMLEFSSEMMARELKITEPGALILEENMAVLRKHAESTWYVALRPYQSLAISSRTTNVEERKMLKFFVTVASVKVLYGHKPGEEPFSYRVVRPASSLREVMLAMEELDIQLDGAVVNHLLKVQDLDKLAYHALDVHLFPEDYRVPRKTWRNRIPFLRAQTAQ